MTRSMKVDDIAPDLVLMDVMMPGMHGFESAASMLRGRLGLGVAMTRMVGSDDYPHMALELEGVGFVKKSDLSAAALQGMNKGFTGRDS